MSKRWTPTRISQADRQMAFDAMAPDHYKKRSLTEGLDHLAGEMERKWGVDRLPLLVSEQLRAAFYRQQDLLNDALGSGDLTLIDIQAGGMKRAWQALDQAAARAGQKPLSADVWEVKLPKSGKIVAIVRTSAEAHLVAGPDRETWTLAEIAHLIDGLDGPLGAKRVEDARAPCAHAASLLRAPIVAEIKRVFPGAEITAIHKTETPEPRTKESFDWAKGDDIPF